MKKIYTKYWKKLLETVAFSYGEICSHELIQNEHTHFHPSGNLTPSKSDIQLTDRLLRLTLLMGIPLIDHVIVGGDNCSYFSFKEKEFLKNPSIHFATTYEGLNFEPASKVAEMGKAR